MSIRELYHKIFPQYQDELERELEGMNTLLDVGCGKASIVGLLKRKPEATGVDIYEPDLKLSVKKKIHKNYVVGDARNLRKHFKKDSFDATLASDVIEHLTKKDGLKMLQEMERVSKKKVIIFTPKGFQPQEPEDDNPYQEHKSGWKPREMEKLGYRVIGIHGWQPLRGKGSALRFWPGRFWQVVSDMTQWVTKRHPKYAFHIMCVKEFT